MGEIGWHIEQDWYYKVRPSQQLVASCLLHMSQTEHDMLLSNMLLHLNILTRLSWQACYQGLSADALERPVHV